MNKSQTKFHLKIGKYTFDPLEKKPELAPEISILKAPQKPVYHIVQFNKVLSQEDRTHIQDE